MNKLKLFSMFSGYGGAEFSLKKANIDFECVGYSEIDKDAIQCYNQNHKKVKNFGDAFEINPNDIPDFDLLTGGFPCQTFSIAGNGMGELDKKGTLFNEIIRIAKIKQPKYMLLENVAGLTYKTHNKTFQKILQELRLIGYDVLYNIYNSKDYGIPQNRERIFFICKLGKWNLFPNEFKQIKKEKLKISTFDILEKDIDLTKYILNDKNLNLLNEKFNNEIEHKSITNNKICISSLREHNSIRTDGITNCLLSSMKINRLNVPMILINKKTNKNLNNLNNFIDAIKHKNNNIKYKKLVEVDNNGNKIINSKNSQYEIIYDSNGLTPTLTCSNDIRHLTPKECFRLMGFLNDEINLNDISINNQYKLAGNGWEINLVSKLFKEMLKSFK